MGGQLGGSSSPAMGLFPVGRSGLLYRLLYSNFSKDRWAAPHAIIFRFYSSLLDLAKSQLNILQLHMGSCHAQVGFHSHVLGIHAWGKTGSSNSEHASAELQS
jgi:hypothetical protein